MEQRKVFALHYLLDRPLADIAAETGTNVNTIKTWLSRGRAALFEKLSETHFEEPNLQLVRDKARRNRKRSLTMTIAAFLATATAAGAAFFALPHPTTPARPPDLVIPYGVQPLYSRPVVIGQRALTLWLGSNGQAQVAAIDLATGTPSWASVSVGRFDHSMFWVGASDDVMVLAGANGSPHAKEFALIAIDTVTGKIVWQRPPQPIDELPAVSPQAMGTTNNPQAPPAIVVREGQTATAIDSHTGDRLWTIPSSRQVVYGLITANSIPEVLPSGVLNIRDLTTGAIISSRSGWVVGSLLTRMAGTSPRQHSVSGQLIGSTKTTSCSPV